MRRTVLKYLHVVFDEDDSREGTFIFVEGKRYVGKCCLKWNGCIFVTVVML